MPAAAHQCPLFHQWVSADTRHQIPSAPGNGHWQLVPQLVSIPVPVILQEHHHCQVSCSYGNFRGHWHFIGGCDPHIVGAYAHLWGIFCLPLKLVPLTYHLNYFTFSRCIHIFRNFQSINQQCLYSTFTVLTVIQPF